MDRFSLWRCGSRSAAYGCRQSLWRMLVMAGVGLWHVDASERVGDVVAGVGLWHVDASELVGMW